MAGADAPDVADCVRFDTPIARAVASDRRRIVVVGAGGWIGRSALQMLRHAIGEEQFTRRVVCFGSGARDIELTAGTFVPQLHLAALHDLACEPTLLLHLAFLTKDKVGGMAEADYIAANQAISQTVTEALEAIGVDRLFVASSGAAAFADDAGAAADLRLYGRLKRADEELFARWAEAGAGRRAVIGRLFALSGPFINKPETYALADLILAVLAGKPAVVRAPVTVERSFVAIREMLSLVFAALLADEADPVLRFDTGGEPLELGELARRVAMVLGGEAQDRVVDGAPGNRYLADHAAWLALLSRFGLTHIPIERQIAETAGWLKATTGLGDAA